MKTSFRVKISRTLFTTSLIFTVFCLGYCARMWHESRWEDDVVPLAKFGKVITFPQSRFKMEIKKSVIWIKEKEKKNER